MEGEDWHEVVVFACKAVLFGPFGVSGRTRRAEREGFSHLTLSAEDAREGSEGKPSKTRRIEKVDL
jgi:hypothetical protein